MTREHISRQVHNLRRHLDAEGVRHPDQLADLLADVWPLLSGSDEHSMRAHKISRIESPSWAPPRLSFTIERHGGTVLGSKRAELQVWEVNLDDLTAQLVGGTYRQLVPNSPRLDIPKLAEEVARAVNENPDDPRLKWRPGEAVQPVLSRIIPSVGPKQTVEGRRRRLRDALPEAMAEVGWEPIDRGVYRKRSK